MRQIIAEVETDKGLIGGGRTSFLARTQRSKSGDWAKRRQRLFSREDSLCGRQGIVGGSERSSALRIGPNSAKPSPVSLRDQRRRARLMNEKRGLGGRRSIICESSTAQGFSNFRGFFVRTAINRAESSEFSSELTETDSRRT